MNEYTNLNLLYLKNILYCGEPDEVVDEYMKHYNGESGTYFSFLPVHHKQSAGYECLLGAIEMGYIGKAFKRNHPILKVVKNDDHKSC